MTQYLGEVLQVRSGLTPQSGFLAELAGKLSHLMHTEGRRWRPLEDTAIASHQLRAHSLNWSALRRLQDYYDEGMLLWLEADTIIREQSDGRRSLDDFCKKFMGPQCQGKISTYDRAEVIQGLNKVAKYDWEKFVRDRVDVP